MCAKSPLYGRLVVWWLVSRLFLFDPQRPSWWPFEISPGTVAFALVWPFVVQWLIRLYLQRRKR